MTDSDLSLDADDLSLDEDDLALDEDDLNLDDNLLDVEDNSGELLIDSNEFEDLALDIDDDFGFDEDDEIDFDENIGDDGDEIATKLDLARAYVDMGDSDGANEILQEVIAEGNDEQKSEAQALIDKAD